MISKNVISIDEVIARTKIQLRIANTTEYDNYLEVMISEALRHLDAITLYVKKQCTLDIVDNRAELPVGFMKLLGMRFSNVIMENQYTANGIEQVPRTIISPVLYVDTKFLNSCDFENSNVNLQSLSSTAQISGNYIHFNSGGIESGKIVLAYMALNTDENGRLLIYEEYERALSSYACYMFTLAYADELGIGRANVYYSVWVAQKQWIKGGAFKDDFQKNKMAIAAAVNALVADKTVTWI